MLQSEIKSPLAGTEGAKKETGSQTYRSAERKSQGRLYVTATFQTPNEHLELLRTAGPVAFAVQSAIDRLTLGFHVLTATIATKRLMSETGLSHGSVSAAIKKLEAAGTITVQRRTGFVSVYTINIDPGRVHRTDTPGCRKWTPPRPQNGRVPVHKIDALKPSIHKPTFLNPIQQQLKEYTVVREPDEILGPDPYPHPSHQGFKRLLAEGKTAEAIYQTWNFAKANRFWKSIALPVFYERFDSMARQMKHPHPNDRQGYRALTDDLMSVEEGEESKFLTAVRKE